MGVGVGARAKAWTGVKGWAEPAQGLGLRMELEVQLRLESGPELGVGLGPRLRLMELEQWVDPRLWLGCGRDFSRR